MTWKAKADCRDMGPDYFYQPRRMPDVMWKLHSKRAKEICSDCEVQDVCYNTAELTQERNGIWGGVDFEESAKERRRQSKRISALKLKK